MNVEVVDAPTRSRPAQAKQPSTSIRVSVATRDVLAREAAAAGVSLAAYLEKVARRSARERALADYRASMVEACGDPAFVAEMQEWDDMDDGIAFDDRRSGVDD